MLGASEQGSSKRTASPQDDDEKATELVLSSEPTSPEGNRDTRKKLSWQRLTVCLIVEAIALGSLSVPSAFATLGLIPGILMSLGIGVVVIYTSYVLGQVKLRHPHVDHYADAVRLIWGRFGYELTGVMIILFMILLVGSHALTGTITFIRVVERPGICALVWGVISAVLLFLLALPPTFADFAILGYIDFVSIVAAILLTVIATGVDAANSPGGLSAVDWSYWPEKDVTFTSAFLASTNIIFAYSFAAVQFTMMTEMAKPEDFKKSILALGIMDMTIYTLVGSLVYGFVGKSVQSPALLSAGPLVSRIAFGIAIPVVFISGSINTTVCGHYILDRYLPNSSIRHISTRGGKSVWVAVIATITAIAWVVAEAIPIFSALLGIISSLFSSGFSFYFPALFWFLLIKEGRWNKDWKNIALTVVNALILVIGLVVLVCGTYASVQNIIEQFNAGGVRGPFVCPQSAYA